MSCTGNSLRIRSGLPGLLLAVCLALLSCLPHPAARADAKSDAQKKQREDTYKAIFQNMEPKGLRTTVDTLAKSSSRVAGYPGDSVDAANYVEGQFQTILGNVQT